MDVVIYRWTMDCWTYKQYVWDRGLTREFGGAVISTFNACLFKPRQSIVDHGLVCNR